MAAKITRPTIGQGTAISKKKAAAAKAAAHETKATTKAVSKKQAATKKTRRPKVEDPVSAAKQSTVTLRSTTQGRSAVVKITTDSVIQDLAIRWNYILARRFRWKNLTSARSELDLDTKALTDFRKIANYEQLDATLRDADVAEIAIDYVDEESSWGSRIAPWEFLISTTAALLGNHKPLTVVRTLQSRTPKPKFSRSAKVLYVQSAPGTLSKHYNYDSELEILNEYFKDRVIECINPSLEELRTTIKEHSPNLIHIAGIDSNEARLLTGDTEAEAVTTKDKDGLVFKTDNDKGYESIPADKLASVLNAGQNSVDLIYANIYHSAARIGSLAVAAGAQLAIGYQDTVNDAVAEVFMREFYASWSETPAPMPAFSYALSTVRDTISVSGAGIVMWSAHSLLIDASQLKNSQEERQAVRSKIMSAEDIADFRSWFEPEIEVKKELNFSALHNNSGGLFNKFLLIKKREGILYDVGVEATLHLGSQSHAYRGRYTVEHNSTPINEKIRIPLTSSIIRTVSEPLRTSLFVEVSLGEKIVLQQTYPVTLNPSDEWLDDDQNRAWLPSFVLPRDPFIEQIIDRAEKHLITLSDNRNSSFDGYQRVGLSEDLQELKPIIDRQVQAIWAAIIFDFGIGYINPPPSGTGQRLRTPSQVARASRGTCIDLALTFAACLEYIDIYPVIILIEGHAFVRYWRSLERYNRFVSGTLVSDSLVDSIDMETRGMSQEHAPWIFSNDSHQEIKSQIEQGYLVALETVDLTEEGSFGDATKKGGTRLDDKYMFNALVDIALARRESISPLPILEN